MRTIPTRSEIRINASGLFSFFLGLILVPAASSAALPPLSGEALRSEAEVIMTGTVVASRVLIVRKPSTSTYLVRLQAAVEKVEKGGELIGTPGTTGSPSVIEIRCWRIRKSDTVGPVGNATIPADGSRFRMWLKKGKEGFWEPLEPNGIELLDDSPAMEFTETERRETKRSFLIGIVGTLLLMGAIAAYLFRRSRRTR